MNSLVRRREALRRLGASCCSRCRNPAGHLQAVPDWTAQEIRVIRGLCAACAAKQVAANEAAVRRKVDNDVAQLTIRRDAQRAQNATSSQSYREACAAMQEDVDAALGRWKIGAGW